MKSSVPANSKLADRLEVVAAGSSAPSTVFGAIVSGASKATVSGAETLPWLSVAVTENVCGPAARPVYVFGLTQVAYGSASMLHLNVSAPGTLSVPLKVNVRPVTSATVATGGSVSLPTSHV